MGKEKEKEKKRCDDCGVPLRDPEAFHHEKRNYCPQCLMVHVKDEHFTPELRKAWTFRSG